MKKLLPLFALALFALAPSDADACALARAEGSTVRIQGEEALIVYDERAHVQHFIRTAAFEGADRDFGFLVPTPAVPELSEVDANVFSRLFEVYRAPPPPQPRGVRSRSANAMPPPQAPAVEVIARVAVAGLDAAVLRASDPNALRGWLSRNGYPASAPLRDWFARYVRQGWIVTAFRIDPGAQRGQGISLRAVRMTFQTNEPFFPYSEPRAASPEPGRPFRVSVVSARPMRVRSGNAAWHGTIGYRTVPGRRLVTALGDVAPSGSFSNESWLTVFDEPSSVRGRDDLFFEAEPNGAQIASTIRAQITAPLR